MPTTNSPSNFSSLSCLDIIIGLRTKYITGRIISILPEYQSKCIEGDSACIRIGSLTRFLGDRWCSDQSSTIAPLLRREYVEIYGRKFLGGLELLLLPQARGSLESVSTMLLWTMYRTDLFGEPIGYSLDGVNGTSYPMLPNCRLRPVVSPPTS